MGNFGSGKTFGTFLELFKLDKERTYIIANVPYSVVDHYYSTTEDLLNVFDVLGEYSIKTNEQVKSFYNNRGAIKDIVLIVDEAHLYLGARESLTKASILNQLKTIFTQCRKRKIRVVFITQRLTQIDIYVRRLADYVEEYEFNKFANIERVKWRLYLNKGDVADIETDTTTKFTNGEAKTYKEDAFITSSFFRPLTSILELFVLFSSAYRRILLEEYQTYHICGYPDLKVEKLTYEKLLAGLQIHYKPKKSFFIGLYEKINGYFSRPEIRAFRRGNISAADTTINRIDFRNPK
ncbi:MAG: zonular occludens toxin domain-containing protein [Candidatus Absconditicoccaceae bacterium]